MIRCMRTTINIDPELLKRARKQALTTGRSLTAFIEDALRAALLPKAASAKRTELQLTTFCGRGPCPGVDLDDADALLEVMER